METEFENMMILAEAAKPLGWLMDVVWDLEAHRKQYTTTGMVSSRPM